jgi:hypothetical protein
MTKKEKIEYGLLAVLLIAVGAVLYFFVFNPQPSAPSQPGTGAPTMPTMGVPGMATSGSASSFLPNGTGIQTGILSDPKFTSLVKPTYPQVSREEVGNPDPFAQPGTTGTSTPAH